MAGRRSSKGNRRNAKARRRGRVVALGGSAGAFLAFGLTPLAAVPAANADFGFDDLIELLHPGLAAGAVDPARVPMRAR
jgi:hypothetical protein